MASTSPVHGSGGRRGTTSGGGDWGSSDSQESEEPPTVPEEGETASLTAKFTASFIAPALNKLSPSLRQWVEAPVTEEATCEVQVTFKGPKELGQNQSAKMERLVSENGGEQSETDPNRFKFELTAQRILDLARERLVESASF